MGEGSARREGTDLEGGGEAYSGSSLMKGLVEVDSPMESGEGGKLCLSVGRLGLEEVDIWEAEEEIDGEK